MANIIEFLDLGRIDYHKAWDLQTQLLKLSSDTKQKNKNLSETERIKPRHYFSTCEHPHVYTLGRNGKEEHLLADEEKLDAIGAEFVKINRGGDITYHGLGQLVGYPILDLDEFFTDIAKYIRFIEEVMIRMLAEYDIKGERIAGESGVWIDAQVPGRARKICAIGVHLSRWITMHGFALNVNTDLSYFSHIVPCGIVDKSVTSMQMELGRELNVAEVREKVGKHFAALFEAELKNIVLEDLPVTMSVEL